MKPAAESRRYARQAGWILIGYCFDPLPERCFMNSRIVSLMLIGGLFATACVAAEAPPATPETDQQRIDSLIGQNRMLAEEIKGLQVEYERPKSKEEAFAACMQAAKGATSAMAAESIGEHCDQLLKR